MPRLAEPLVVAFNLIRFRSLVNRRVFSLLYEHGEFELVELDEDFVEPSIVKILYEGNDAKQVKQMILQEVCDV